MDPEVIETMVTYMRQHHGNPSSIHADGRGVRTKVEEARKTVAKLLNTSPSEIFFTSGGTEADNMAIRCTINDLGIKHAITTSIEHHAVVHTLEELAQEGLIKLSFVQLDEKGSVDILCNESSEKIDNKLNVVNNIDDDNISVCSDKSV
jgi:cysteine desulfurase